MIIKKCISEPVGGIIFLRLLPLHSLHLAMRSSIHCRTPGINRMHFHPFAAEAGSRHCGLARNDVIRGKFVQVQQTQRHNYIFPHTWLLFNNDVLPALEEP